MLAEDLRNDARYVRCGEAVAGRRDPTSIGPRYTHVYARRPELHGRLRVVVEEVRIVQTLVGGH